MSCKVAEVFFIPAANLYHHTGGQQPAAKGQLISKYFFVSSNLPKPKESFARISALGSKQRSNQKNKV